MNHSGLRVILIFGLPCQGGRSVEGEGKRINAMKSKRRKTLGIILIVFAILIIVGLFTVPKLIDLNRYTPLIVEKMEEALGGKVRVGHISWGIADGIWLEADGFSMVDASAFPGDVRLTRVHTDVSILPLLTKKVVVSRLVVEGPEVKLRFKHDTTVEEPQKDSLTLSAPMETETWAGDKDQPAASSPKTSDTKEINVDTADAAPGGVHLPVRIEIDQLSVEIRRLEIEDAVSVHGQTMVHIFNDVDLTATHVVPGEKMAFNVSLHDEAASGIGKLDAEGTFSGLTDTFTLKNPNLKVKAEIRAMHADAFKPYLVDSPLGKNIDGIVSMELNYESDLSKIHRLEGEIDLGDLTYTDFSIWDAPLPGQKTTLAFRGTLDPQEITVEKMALKLGGLSLIARADVRAWEKAPVIKNAQFSFELPLTEVKPLVPWKLLGKNAGIIRSILEGGGNITAHKGRLPEIALSDFSPKIKDMLSGIEMEAQIVGVSVKLSPEIPKLENINGTIHLGSGTAQVTGLRARLASTDLPEVSAKITNLQENPKIDARIKGRLNATVISQEAFGKKLRELGLEKLTGEADVDMAVELESDRPGDFQAQGSIGLKDMLVKTVFSPALLYGFNADIAITPDVAHISKLSSTVALKREATSPEEQFSLDVQGNIDDWSQKPAVTLTGFRTSPVSLSLLAMMVPWEKLDASATTIKEILVAGGTLTIEDLALPKVDLSEPPKVPAELLPRVKLAARLEDLTVPGFKTLPGIEGITGRVTLENDTLVAEKLGARLGPLSLPTFNVRASNIAGHPKVALRAEGPIQVASTGDLEIQKLLMAHGLKSLTGSGFIDMRADFDQAAPKSWTASGSLVLNGIRAETHPAAVVMENLKGSLKFSRDKTMDVTAEDITALINKATVQFSGKALDIGTPKMLVTAKAYAKQLDLADLGALLPPFHDHNLGGMLDMNLSVYVPYEVSTKSQLNGTLTTHNAGFRLTASGLSIEKANTTMELSGQSVDIKTLTMQVNDQQVTVSGRISNPVEPKSELLVHSPNLNLDRLLPEDKGGKPGSKPPNSDASEQKKEPVSKEKAGAPELPSIMRKLTADIQVSADQGRYQRIQFQKLNLTLHYARGVVESYDFNFGTENGQVKTKGSADLRDLNQIAFTVEPDINALDLGRVASVHEMEKLPVNGPMSLKGRLQGRIGSTKDLLGSLDGHLNADMGPGRLKNVGILGTLLGKIFSMANLQSIFSGRILQDLSGEGISFNTINAQTSFAKGTLNLNSLHLQSDAMDVNSQGTIDLVNKRIKTTAHLEPLATVGKALDFIPIVGKAAGDLITIRIDVEGPLDDPKIRTSQIKQVGKAVKSVGKGTGDFLKGIGKGIKGVFEK